MLTNTLTNSTTIMVFTINSIIITGDIFGLNVQSMLIATLVCTILMGLDKPISFISGMSEIALAAIVAGGFTPILSVYVAGHFLNNGNNEYTEIKSMSMVIISIAIGLLFRYIRPIILKVIPKIVESVINKFLGF